MGVMFVRLFLSSPALSVAAAAAANVSILSLVNHLTEILIPWPFQPPHSQTLVGCGVVEVGDLVVQANSTAQRQTGSCCLSPPNTKKRSKSPQKV